MEKFTQAPVGLDIDQTVSSNSTAIANLDGSQAILVSDYNLVTTTGLYKAQATSTTLNPPDSSNPGRWYQLTVRNTGNSGNYISQIAHSPGTNIIYARIYYSSYGWSAWQELVTKSELFAAFKVVSVRKYIIDSGTLSAGSNGYVDFSITVPSGYKTTGAASVLLVHPGTAGGLQVVCGVEHSKTGTYTMSASYYTPKNIPYSNTDFIISVLCVKSDFSLTVT